MTLALQATCRPGDTVAIGSPIYFPFLHRIQWMGLKVLEIPSSPREGIDLAVLSRALRHNPIHACISIPNFDNPLGCLMPEEKKRPAPQRCLLVRGDRGGAGDRRGAREGGQ